ncbi:senecionine N-oxygenase-like isoform X2 [Lycorma delicatula]|uniref:senecionine N-oxygenase-like isoform X2 n=1 Tax=Lycorma delicatula TaxID=130591 RepID=UPI003F50E497
MEILLTDPLAIEGASLIKSEDFKIKNELMRVAIIGAGAAGLCAAQHLSTVSNNNTSFIVYEQTGNVGGTWTYTENTGVDEYGLPIHSSMYKNLRTNLPKETMTFSSFPFRNEKSFVPRSDVLQYLKDFADYYNLKKYIKFYHYVTEISPINEKWKISIKNLQTNEENVVNFDAVMVCIGHYSKPRFPIFTGMDIYKKKQMHSHAYRYPESFEGKTIIIVGSGPSGMDIIFDAARYAKKIFFSHHNYQLINEEFPNNVVHKSDIASLSESTVTFQDGTSETADVILYCTGYTYSFPFLSEECGIEVEDNFVQPLYKQLININHPTMCFIGIPWQTFIFPMFDLQVCCFINVLENKVDLPSEEEMLLSLKAEIAQKKLKREEPKYFHRLGVSVREYMADLAEVFGVEPIPEVVHKIYECTVKRRKQLLRGFREDVYKVICDTGVGGSVIIKCNIGSNSS